MNFDFPDFDVASLQTAGEEAVGAKLRREGTIERVRSSCRSETEKGGEN
jgi:hypothetical protein